MLLGRSTPRSTRKRQVTSQADIHFPDVLINSSSFPPNNIISLSKHAKTRSGNRDHPIGLVKKHDIEMNINQFDIKCYVNNDNSVQNVVTLKKDCKEKHTVAKSHSFQTQGLGSETSRALDLKNKGTNLNRELLSKTVKADPEKNINLFFSAGNLFDYHTQVSVCNVNSDPRLEMTTTGGGLSESQRPLKTVGSLDDVENKGPSLIKYEPKKRKDDIRSIYNYKDSSYKKDKLNQFKCELKSRARFKGGRNCVESRNEESSLMSPRRVSLNNARPFSIKPEQKRTKVEVLIIDENSPSKTRNNKREYSIDSRLMAFEKIHEASPPIEPEGTMHKPKEVEPYTGLTEIIKDNSNKPIDRPISIKEDLNNDKHDNSNNTQMNLNSNNAKALSKSLQLKRSIEAIVSTKAKGRLFIDSPKETKSFFKARQTARLHTSTNLIEDTANIPMSNLSQFHHLSLKKRTKESFSMKNKTQNIKTLSKGFDQRLSLSRLKEDSRDKQSDSGLSNVPEDPPDQNTKEDNNKDFEEQELIVELSKVPINRSSNRDKSKTIHPKQELRPSTKLSPQEAKTTMKSFRMRNSQMLISTTPSINSKRGSKGQRQSTRSIQSLKPKENEEEALTSSSCSRVECERMLSSIFKTIHQANQLDNQLNASYSYDEIDVNSSQYKAYHSLSAIQKNLINKRHPNFSERILNRKETFLLSTLRHLKKCTANLNNEINRKNFLAEIALKLDNIKENLTVDDMVISLFHPQAAFSLVVAHKMKDTLLGKYFDMMDDIANSIVEDDKIDRKAMTKKKTKRTNGLKALTQKEMIGFALRKAENTMYAHHFIKRDLMTVMDLPKQPMLDIMAIKANVNRLRSNSISPKRGGIRCALSKTNTLDTVKEPPHSREKGGRGNSPLKNFLQFMKKKRSNLGIAQFLQFNRRIKRKKNKNNAIELRKPKSSSKKRHSIHYSSSFKEMSLLKTNHLKQKYVKSLGNDVYALLEFYIKEGNLNKVNALFNQSKCSFDINHLNAKGNSFVILAVMSNDFNMCQNLLKKGCNPNIQNNNQLSALHYALCEKKFDIANLLLKYGASESAINSLGLNPWECFTTNV